MLTVCNSIYPLVTHAEITHTYTTLGKTTKNYYRTKWKCYLWSWGPHNLKEIGSKYFIILIQVWSSDLIILKFNLTSDLCCLSLCLSSKKYFRGPWDYDIVCGNHHQDGYMHNIYENIQSLYYFQHNDNIYIFETTKPLFFVTSWYCIKLQVGDESEFEMGCS